MIQTTRLRLRPLREDDAEALHAIFSDPRAMRYWDRPAWDDIAETRRFLTMCIENDPTQSLEYAVERDGAVIGRVAMWKRWELGYLIHPAHWGQGLATEAMRALVDAIAARFPEAETLTAEIDPRNIASARVLERLGFRQTGFAPRSFLYGGTEWCDTAYYACALRQDV